MPRSPIPSHTANEPVSSANTPQACIWAVVPAAGVGHRMQASQPKQFLVLAGQTLIERSVAALLRNSAIAGVVVVVANNDATTDQLLPKQARLHIAPVGASTRAESVMNGLDWVIKNLSASPSDWALVHDAARPGLSQPALQRLIDSVLANQKGAILALPPADTVKQAAVGYDSGPPSVHQTIDRATVWLAQTPQMFRLGLLAQALKQASNVTDEASAMEAAGHEVQLILGERRNLKVTVPEDLVMLEALIKGELNWTFA
jgi:2-C-methyl-D-erythritol 4-phosphate cytidylyltransferase